jgi:hypothetical protein
MACCGQRRQQIRRAPPVQPANSSASNVGISGHMPTEIPVAAFQYTGRSALTAIGPISGRQYRLGYPAAVVSVDSRDAASLGTVPNLRRV